MLQNRRPPRHLGGYRRWGNLWADGLVSANRRADGASMRLAEQIKKVGKHGRSQKSDHDGPPHELLAFSAVRSPHAGQEVVAVLLFVLSGPKHSRSPALYSQSPRIWQTNKYCSLLLALACDRIIFVS